MKHLKTKLFFGASGVVLLISVMAGLSVGHVSAATTPKIYVTSAGVDVNDTAIVEVDVQISTLGGNTSPGPNAFSGDTIQVVGNNYFILDSSGNQVDQIPSAINLAIIDVGSGNHLGTYDCGNNTATTLAPCGSDYITPGDQNGKLTISASGVVPYSANFDASDENSAPNVALNSYNFVGCPSGTNITSGPACNTSSAAQKTWTVQSCSVNNPSTAGSLTLGLVDGGTCVTVLGNTGLVLPLPAGYKAPADLLIAAPTGQSAPSCDESGFVLSWIFCPLINGMVDGISAINTHIIKHELQVTPIVTSSPTAACQTNPNGSSCDPAHSYAIWSAFRLYGNIILVIALLFLVFGEIMGGGVVDAYTLKKMLPRILIAAILINLSIYIVAALIDVSNVIGSGITYLINQPFAAAGADTIKFSDLSGLLGGVGVAGSIWAVGGVLGASVLPFLLLFIVLPAFVAIIGVILTILLRQALIILLVLSAPIAFALYCLPNTEQYFKKWWSLLFKTLLIFPIIEAFFALSTALAITISATGGSDPITQILAVIALFVPLFMIPFAFKIAGGILGGVYGAVNGTGKKLTEAIKGNPNDPNSLRNRSRRQILERATQYQGKFVEPGRKALGNTAKDRRQRAVTRVADLFGNYDARIAGYNEAAAKRREVLANYGNDDLLYAGGGYEVKAGQQRLDKSYNSSGHSEYYNSKGKKINREMYSKGKSLYGGSQHDITQSLNYAVLKSQTDGDLEAFQFAFNRNAEANKWDQSQIAGNYLGATIPYKGRNVFLRQEIPKLNEDGSVTTTHAADNSPGGDSAYFGGLKQMHTGGESYKLSSVSAPDWMTMNTKQKQLEQKIIDGTDTPVDRRNLAMTYEVLDGASQRMRTPGYTETIKGEGGEDQIVAGGASPASQAIIESAVGTRRFNIGVANPDTMEKKLTSIPERTNNQLISRPDMDHIEPVMTTGPDVT